MTSRDTSTGRSLREVVAVTLVASPFLLFLYHRGWRQLLYGLGGLALFRVFLRAKVYGLRSHSKLTPERLTWWREFGTEKIVSECNCDFQCFCGAPLPATGETVSRAKVVTCAKCGKTVEIGLLRGLDWNMPPHRETWGYLQAWDIKTLLVYLALFSVLLYYVYDLLHW